MTNKNTPEVQEVIQHLETEMRARGVTQRDLQRALGWGRSYVSQLMTGQTRLKVEHVFSILSALKIEKADFFRTLYEDKQDLERRFHELDDRIRDLERSNRVNVGGSE